ncbi:MAG: preprotein translocase subunit YajC [Bacillota bacterium]|nr:preprotein translocase subunit YajC [Bacillota bacterium]
MGNSMVWTIVYFVAIIAIIYFLLIRPQKKRTKQHTDMVNNLTLGVEVVSIGGIHGEVSRIKDDTIWMKVSNNVEIELEKSAIGRIVS